MKKILIILSILFTINLHAADFYTLDKCIETALVNNPSLASAQKSLDASGTRVWQSASVFFPTINASGAMGRSRAESASSPDDFNYTSSMSAGLSASMPVFTFGKNYYSLTAQQATYKSSEYDYQSTLNQTVYNVKKAYFNLVYAKKNTEVLQETVKQYETHLKQAQAFYDVGIKPKIDVTNAEVNLNTNKLNLMRAQNSVKIAYATLNNVMGVKNATSDYDVDENVDFISYEISLESALERALTARPDYLSAQSKTVSAKKSLNATKAQHLPDINASASFGYSGREGLDYENGAVGLSASLPIFNGLKTTYKVREARDTYEAKVYDEEASKQSVVMDVTQAVANLEDAQGRIPVSKLNAETAKENFDLARGRYNVGIGNNIEVVDAENSYRNAELQYASALTDYRIAIADVMRSVGTR